MRRAFLIGATVFCAISLGSHAADASTDAMSRSRQLTRWFYAGQIDSLLAAVRAFDLVGSGDSVVARWVREPGGTVPPNWPEGPATLEGRDGLAKMITRAHAMFGRESARIEDAIYGNNRVAGLSDYFRIARFTGKQGSSVTLNWTVDREGQCWGGFLMPTPRIPPSKYDGYRSKTRLRLPFDGEWMVLQGGRKPHENDHLFHEPLRYACDFVVVRDGVSFSGGGTENSDHYAFGLPILAPAAGHVLAEVDTFPENTPPDPRPGYMGPGNFIVIDHGNGEYSVLAHLKRGSVTVARGDSVSTGQKIGECGNNGFSTEPHLHYQLQISPRPGGPVVPAGFIDYWADGVHVARGEPRKGQQVRAK